LFAIARRYPLGEGTAGAYAGRSCAQNIGWVSTAGGSAAEIATSDQIPNSGYRDSLNLSVKSPKTGDDPAAMRLMNFY
jgi:hypothetical protein